MTKKLFWEDPYLTNLETIIESVVGDSITLQETIFFAFSGGQESDTGTIGDYPVLVAKKSGLDILYVLSEDHKLKPNDKVRIKIDWDRRYRLMRLHFAAELILVLVCRELDNAEKIGAHISPEKARIDFHRQENISTLFPVLTSQAQFVINQNLEIISAYSDEDSQARYWEIKDFARVPCSGAHLKRTGEVGKIELKRKNIGKNKERIEIYADKK